MKYKICFSLVFFIVLFYFVFFIEHSKKPHLKILTYSSFSGVYGPGKKIQKKFEAICNCKIQWFLAEDSTALLRMFKILPDIDLVLGWDQITLRSAIEEAWEDLSFFRKKKLIQKRDDLPNFFVSPYFLPINWSPIGFLYKQKIFSFIKSLKSLPDIEAKISFPEPRSSSLGLQFYYWIYTIFKGDLKHIEDFLKRIKDKIYGPVFSWSMSYGFFQKDKTSMSLSYLSSLLYHQKEEPNKNYFFSFFEEGQAYQVEYISISSKSQSKSMALNFVKFLFSEKIQTLLQETHYMFPVSKQVSTHALLKTNPWKWISYKDLEAFLEKKKELLSFWEKHLY